MPRLAPVTKAMRPERGAGGWVIGVVLGQIESVSEEANEEKSPLRFL